MDINPKRYLRKITPLYNTEKQFLSFIALALGIILIPVTVNLTQKGQQNQSIASTSTLKSILFLNDPTALSIINGTPYTLNQTSLYSGNNFIIESFEYKIFSGLRELGYYKSSSPGLSMITELLQIYETDRNLPNTPTINSLILSSLDEDLHRVEIKDNFVANIYEPSNRFLPDILGEVPRYHFIALLANFFNALPSSIPERILTSQDLCRSVVTLGQNIGSAMDINRTRFLGISEQLSICNSGEGYLYCPHVYYSEYENIDNNQVVRCESCCVSPSTLLNPILTSSGDINYMVLLIHEYGHVVGRLLNNLDPTFYNQFYNISWNGQTTIRNDINEFVSTYAMSLPVEDFAESFAAYISVGKIFRNRSTFNQFLNQKYEFLRTKVFNNKEYETGTLLDQQIWEQNNGQGIPDHPEYYLNGFWSNYYPNHPYSIECARNCDVTGDGCFSENDITSNLYLSCYSQPANRICSQLDTNSDEYITILDVSRCTTDCSCNITPTPTTTPNPTRTPTPSPIRTPTPTLTATPIPTPTPILGDADGDGNVDEDDYNIWRSHYDHSLIQPGGPAIGNFNADNKVDGADFTIWLNNYRI